MTQFLCYPKCTTCKRAASWLEQHNISVEMRDITKNNPTKEELAEWFITSGKPISKFFNTSGIKYRELNLKEAVKSKTDDELLDILASDGMLVKRPLFIKDGLVLIGFKEAEWEQIVK